MATKFRIGVNTEEEILSTPPPQFRHVKLLFTPFAVRVGQRDYPAPFWTDFAGVFLFKWYRAVLKLASGKTHAARLPFWYTYEMWLQQTPRQRWQLSLVQREQEEKKVLHRATVIPEVVESALLTAIQQLLAGARNAGIWTEDCAALDALLKGRESYLADLESGRIPRPRFLTGSLPSPLQPDTPMWDMPFRGFLARTGDPCPSSAERNLSPSIGSWISAPPLPCPKCGAVVKPGDENQCLRSCPLCGYEVRLQ